MATSSKIQLLPEDSGVFHVKAITKESAAKASELLQENHDKHHIVFNSMGLHNHIVHHLLTIFALGASPATLQRQYDINKSYQTAPPPVHSNVVQDLHNRTIFRKHLRQYKYYHDYLLFFQGEMDKKGYEDVINEYVFKGDDRAEDLLVRMFGGFLHPLIHLGFGIEFKQPAIIAEALAEAAVHEPWLTAYFKGAEEATRANSQPTSKSLVQLLDEIRADRKLSTAAHWDDGNKIRDGILVCAPEEMLKYASQWIVPTDRLREKTAEMTNAVVYFTGAAQHPPKQIKFDFYYIHSLNSSIFFSAFLNQSWISSGNRARLLEWKGRFDLCMYASRRSPKPLVDEIMNYQPKVGSSSSSNDAWGQLFDRVKEHEEDGHASKLVRALAHGAEICRPYEGSRDFRIKNDMWLKLGNMAIDSVEDTGESWVRSAGFEEAWVKYDDRPRAQL